MERVDKYFTALSSDGATLAKVIATFSVVLTHSYKLFKYMDWVQTSEVFYLGGIHAFASCGVPVFFLLSGYFLTFKDNWDYKRNLKKKVNSLLVPYCFFILVYTFISIIGSLVLPDFFDDFKSFTGYDWLIHLVGIPFVKAPIYYGPLWFIRDLFVLNVLSCALVPIVKKAPGYILIPAMIVIYFLPISQIVRYSIPFFVAGMKFGFNKKIPVLIGSTQVIIWFILAFSIPVIFDGGLAWKMAVFLMTGFILFVSEILIKKETVKKVSKIAISFSFPIYLLHEYPVTTIMRLLAMRNPPISLASAMVLTVPFIVIFACVIVIIIWRYLFPKSYALFTGGR